MKAGRPSFHIPACWISVNLPGKPPTFFKLDKKGNICKSEAQQPPLMPNMPSSNTAPAHTKKKLAPQALIDFPPPPLPSPTEIQNEEPLNFVFDFTSLTFDDQFADSWFVENSF